MIDSVFFREGEIRKFVRESTSEIGTQESSLRSGGHLYPLANKTYPALNSERYLVLLLLGRRVIY